MPKPRAEEQFPLLLVLVGEQDVSQNNQRFFGKGRFDGITSGATAIITEWPNYISSCWLTALICGITLFTLSFLLTSCMQLQEQHAISPRCSSDYQITGNKTIHLVHASHKWYPHQLKLLENITKEFPSYQIHLLVINNKNFKINKKGNETSILKTNTKKEHEEKANITKREVSAAKVNNETRAVIILNKTDNTLDDLVKRYPNMLITQIPYKTVFENSPLFLKWVSLSHQTKIFATRVMQIWQHGGLSYDLMEHKMHPSKKRKNSTNLAEMKLREYIRSGRQRYEKLDQDEVSVDVNGFHMECKTPCHAFFAKVLVKLQRADEKSTPRHILNGPMFTFCRVGVINSELCHIKNIFS